MTDDTFELTRAEQPDPGTYTATCTDVKRETVDFLTGDGPQDCIRFFFHVETGDNGVNLDMVANMLDSAGNSAYGNPRYKLSKVVNALLGTLPETITPDTLIGAQALGVLELDGKGYLKLATLTAMPKGAKSK